MKPEPGSSGHAQARDKLKGKGVFSWAGVRSRPRARPEEHFSRQTSAGACTVGTGTGAPQVTPWVQLFLECHGQLEQEMPQRGFHVKWHQQSPSFCLQAVPAQTPLLCIPRAAAASPVMLMPSSTVVFW